MHRKFSNLKQIGQFAGKWQEKLKANRQQKASRGKASDGDEISIFKYAEVIVSYACGVRGGQSNSDICRYV